MKLRFTPRAVEDLSAIADYIRSRNPTAASEVRAAIYGALQTLLLFPYAGRPQETEGVRKFVTRKYAYLVYYAVERATEEVVVLNVKHPARERDHEDS